MVQQDDPWDPCLLVTPGNAKIQACVGNPVYTADGNTGNRYRIIVHLVLR